MAKKLDWLGNNLATVVLIVFSVLVAVQTASQVSQTCLPRTPCRQRGFVHVNKRKFKDVLRTFKTTYQEIQGLKSVVK